MAVEQVPVSTDSQQKKKMCKFDQMWKHEIDQLSHEKKGP